MSAKIRVEMKPISTIMSRLGIDKNGDVQMQTTRIINKRITRYMPFRTGALSTKLKRIKSSTEIEVFAPYARYQYYGKVMVDSKTGKGPMNIPGVGLRFHKGTTLMETDRDLEYDTTKHPNAGPYWDKRLMAAEKEAIIHDIQTYVDRRKNDTYR